jgi:hypothetical protein
MLNSSVPSSLHHELAFPSLLLIDSALMFIVGMVAQILAFHCSAKTLFPRQSAADLGQSLVALAHSCRADEPDEQILALEGWGVGGARALLVA